MPLAAATAMSFDRRFTALGRPLYEELRAIIRSSAVVHADETSWREAGQNGYLWFAGNRQVSVYLVSPDRSGETARQLLGEGFDGTLVTDDYGAYNAVDARGRQTCWQHLRTRAKEIARQIELIDPPPPGAAQAKQFCKGLNRFAIHLCALGKLMEQGKLSVRKAKAMIPALRKRLDKIAGRKPLEHQEAQTLRLRVMEKDRDKLFTFLRTAGVSPTNNHAEQQLRFLVIMRKISFGTRSGAGSESHGVLPSFCQTLKKQGKKAIDFFVALITRPLAEARAVLLGDGP